MSLLPPDDELELLQSRTYETRVYLVDGQLLARGVVRDQKPAGLLVHDDPEPIDMHQMMLELRISVPDLTITAVNLDFEAYPNPTCPSIAESYQQLVGLSIDRGFTHRIRELFGGPRGCTHVVALLQALAPSVVQATWSLSSLENRSDGDAKGGGPKRGQFERNTNTCHIWAEDGSQVALVRAGEMPAAPIPVSVRLIELGRDPEQWRGA